MEFDEALARLDALINFETTPRAGAIEGLSLEPMQRLVAALGDPQDAYPVIHITGTNGKGSTSRLLESLLQTMGLRVGTYASPHLQSVTERIRLAGEPIRRSNPSISSFRASETLSPCIARMIRRSVEP